jgi:hypothetical protein
LVILCSTCSRIWEWWLLFSTKNQIDLELNTFQFITRLIDRCAFDLLVSDELKCITSRLAATNLTSCNPCSYWEGWPWYPVAPLVTSESAISLFEIWWNTVRLI